MRQTDRRLALQTRALTLSILVALCLPTPVLAQLGRRNLFPVQPEVFITAPRELRRELEQAAEDLKNESYVDAIARLDLILAGGDGSEEEFGEDYFLPGSGPSLKSLRSQALDIIANLSPAGREAYELQMGTDARVALDNAMKQRDTEALITVARRYAGTLAGQDAAMLLGRDRLQRGRALEAVLALQRLFAAKSARERFGGELRVLLATAFAISGKPDQANEILSESDRRPLELTVGGQALKPPGEGDDLMEWLTAYTGPLPRRDAYRVTDWNLLGGSDRRSSVSDVDMPMRALRWAQDFAWHVGEKAEIRRQAKTLGSRTALPAPHPLVTNGWVLMRSTDQLWGVDLATGKVVWEYPWSPNDDIEGGALTDPFGNQGSQRNQLIKSRVWDDALYGQLSCDGEIVYLLNKLPRNYVVGTNRTAPTNELVALHLEKEGYFFWSVGGAEGAEPELADVLFLGPPLPVQDALYCIAELNNEIRLLVLDKATGRMSWSQQLAQVDDARMASMRGPRRQAGVNPSHADGILVCPTSVGGVVAIDVASRSFLWGFRYQTRARSSRSSRSADHWRDNWSMIANGKVILTPFDSNQMYCLDLLTGKSLWSQPRPRGVGLYTAGVHDNNVIVVGSNQVTAVNLDTGKDTWNLAIEGKPSGRGVQGPEHYFLATTTPELLKIDLATGTVAEAMPTEESLGNLVAYRDHFVSQNPHRVQAFYQRAKLEREVARKLEDNPDSAWALEHRALLLLEAGKRDVGLAHLRRAIANYEGEGQGASLAAKQLLLGTTLDLLRQAEPGSTDLAAEIEPLIAEFPDRRDEFLRVMTVNLQREGRLEEAFAKSLNLFQTSLSAADQNGILSDVAELKRVSKQRQVRDERWHRALFHDLWKAANETQRGSMRQLISEHASQATPDQLASLVSVFQDTGVLVEQHLQRLEYEIEQQSISPFVESQLRRIQGQSDPRVAGKATALLVQLYVSAKRFEAAAHGCEQLRDSFADVVVDDSLTGDQFVEELGRRTPKLLPHLRRSVRWPTGIVTSTPIKSTVKRSTTRRPVHDGFNRLHTIRTNRPGQDTPHGLQLVYDQMGYALQGRDRFGHVHPLADLSAALPGMRRSELEVEANGHLIVAVRRGSVVAINGLAGGPNSEKAILWTDKIESSSPYSGTSNGPPISFGETGLRRTVGSPNRKIVELGPVSDRGVVFRRYGELVCLDPRDGEKLWVRDDIAMGAEVWGDDDYVFVHLPGRIPGQDSNARVFSMLDGSELESRPVPDQRWRIRNFGRYVLSWTYEIPGDVSQDVDAVLDHILRFENNIENIRDEAPPEVVRRVLVNRIQLNDIFSGRSFEWAHTFEFGARATFVDEDKIAVFEPRRQRFSMFSVLSGKMLIDQSIDVTLSRVDRLHVERRAGRYLVRLSADTNGRIGDKVKFTPLNNLLKTQDIELFAFDLAGEPVWKHPARLHHFMPADFPGEDIPFVVFMRRLEDGAPKRQLHTIVLDARDGSKIHESTEQADGSTFHVRADGAKHEVELRLPSLKGAVTLTFTDEPRDASAPYDQYQSPKRQSNKNLLGTLYKAILQGVSDSDAAEK